MKKSSAKRLKRIFNILVIFVSFVLLWYLLCILLNEPIRLASPHRVIYGLVRMCQTVTFWEIILHSTGRILIGCSLGCFLGAVFSIAEQDLSLAVFGSIEKYFKALPLLPILLALSFASFDFSSATVILACIVASFASVRKAMKAGHQSLSKELLLITRCNSSYWETVYYLRLPHLTPYFSRGMPPAFEKSFAIGLLVEFISCTPVSIGKSLSDAYDSILTEQVFAWVLVAIILYLLVRFLLICTAKRIRFSPRLTSNDQYARNGKSFPIVFDKISKSDGERKILNRLSFVFSCGKSTAVCGSEGLTKTTILSIAAGISHDDEKKFQFPPTASALIFKNPCLVPNLTVRENILLANRAANLSKILKALALVKEENKMPADLDFTTQKRVAIARAIAFGGGIGVFDEPFYGMDDDTRALSAAALFGAFRGKTVIFSAVQGEDILRYADEVLEAN